MNDRQQKPFCYHDGRNIVGKEYAHHCDVFPLYTAPQPAQQPNMPEQYVMVGRFMLQPHPENGYWLTDTGTCEAMQIFQPEMERVIKDLWKQF